VLGLVRLSIFVMEAIEFARQLWMFQNDMMDRYVIGISGVLVIVLLMLSKSMRETKQLIQKRKCKDVASGTSANTT
jgi:hypothetical protein